MQYRLLRNNKESGPYTKVQLEEMGLKPYDLLLIEGRGGAWQYASEIDDLKSIAPVVEEQPYDRFYKGKDKTPVTAAGSRQNVSYTINAATSTASDTATLKPPKPRFRISGDKVVMIDDAPLQQPKPVQEAISAFTKTQPADTAVKPAVKQEVPQQVQRVGLDWEDAYSDWKGEEKEPAVKPEPAKVQTMEEVKQHYEESKRKHLNENKSKTSNSAKQNIMAAVAVAVLAVGGYAGYKINQDSNTTRSTQATPAVEKAEVIQDDNNKMNTGNDAANTAVNTVAQQTSGNTDEAANEINNSLQKDNAATANPVPAPVENKTAAPDRKDNQKEEATPAKTGGVNTPEKLKEKSVQQQPSTTGSKENTITANNTTTSIKDKKVDNVQQADVQKANTAAPVQAPLVVKHEAPAKKINDYITVSKLGSNNSSVQNVLLLVKNVSDFPIDLAVIDIQYFDANGRYQKGETMYVKNIGASSNVNVRIPDGKTAHSISYKVSLVSAEQKTLYLVGD